MGTKGRMGWDLGMHLWGARESGWSAERAGLWAALVAGGRSPPKLTVDRCGWGGH